MSPRNPSILRAAIERTRPDAICLSHEQTFWLADIGKQAGVGVVLYAHNVSSQIADTDASLTSRIFAVAIDRFERRAYGDPGVELVCVSASDARYLAARGIRRAVAIAPPGAPPAVPLAPDAPVEAALVITGHYGWWRKRRDLRRFAAEPSGDPAPCYVSRAAAAAADIEGARTAEGLEWSAAIRFGLITDRFAGGFKLKSTEYVAHNCAVLSYVDIGEEFAGLPHAEAFVRRVESRAEAEEAAREMATLGPDVALRFSTFKTACLERFDWSRTLQPLEAALERAAARSGREVTRPLAAAGAGA